MEVFKDTSDLLVLGPSPAGMRELGTWANDSCHEAAERWARMVKNAMVNTSLCQMAQASIHIVSRVYREAPPA